MKRDKRQLLNRIALSLVLSTSVCGTVFAVPAATTLPTGNVNVTGANTVANDAAWTAANPVMRIVQDKTTTNAQIDWNTFSIGSAATVNIEQASSNMTLVNRVVTNSMSEIYGKMNASGNVVLVNPNGILLAKGSEINAGGFAAYASAGTKLTDPANRLSEGNIIADGTINVGVSTAKALATKFGVENFAVGLGAASGFGNANKIALVANGDVTVNKDAKLTAVDTTVSNGSSTQGAEGFNMGGIASSVTGTVYIRPDANDNDYGQVYLNGSKLFTANAVDVYYNANVKGTATTNDGVLYNKKDFANDGGKQWTDMNDNATTISKTTATLNTDAGTVSYLSKDGTAGAASTVKGYALVHNMAQLQDIDTTIDGKANADGKLDGQYALGKDLYAQKDTVGNDYSYVLKHNGTNENPIIFTTTDGAKMTAVSGKDSGIFNSATQKTLRNGAVLNYTAGNVTSTYGGVSYTYNGTTITDGTGNTYTVGTDDNGYTAAKNGVAITDINVIATLAGLTIAHNEFQDQTDLTTYLGKDAATVAKEFAHMNTSTWNENKGFDPIGNDATPFTGTIFGIGGDVIHIGDGLSEVHTIYDLPINLPTTDNVGLVGVGSGATIDYVQEANTSITGHSNVGGMMGKALNGSTVSDSANIGNGINGTTDISADSGYIRTTSTDQVSNIGGLVGDLEGSSIVESANSATIIGQVDPITDLNVKNVGGLAGTANSSNITRSVNQGNVFGEEKTGGIVGNAISTKIGTASLNDPTESVSNNGKVTGTKDTGGIAGYGSDIHMYGVYNTNEDTALSGNSQYIIDPTGKIIGRNPTFIMRKGNQYDADGHLTGYSTSLAGNGIYSDAALSVYGAVTGDTNTGGLVGEMESTSTIDTAYNAGNITGKTDTGGLIGKLNTTTNTTYTTNIKNAYNGDNNTVIREDLGTIPSKVKAIANVEFDPVQSGSTTANSYSFNPGDANYYSFYTQDAEGKKTYYYFIPTGGKTEAGAGGVFVTYNAATDAVTFVKTADLPNSTSRIYTNRVGYKDANINGTTNTGGLIGEMNSGVVTTTYDTGTVNKGVAGATTGALVGTKTGGTLTTSFFANDTDKTTTTTKPYSGQANAVGTGTADAHVAGNTLAYWRNSDNIKALSNDGSFLGEAATVDSATGYQKFTGSDGRTYYWSTKSDVYYYDGTNTKQVYLTYDKTTDKYKDASNNSYTVTGTVLKENENSQAGSASYIYTDAKFTPVSAGTSLTIDYVTHASNETTDNTWIEYPDETTPLLQHFMFPNNIARHLTYDAKTHNFKTDDVNNVYGRADFTDGVSGKNVDTNNQAQSADPDHQGESEYFYNSAAIWSPQHGYKINANVSVTITAGKLDVTIQGTRVYGDAGNTTGYYVVVPYKLPLYDANGFEIRDADGNIKYGDQQWAYYTVNDGSGSTPYTLMTDADWTYGGKDYRSSTTTPKPEDLLALCNAKATYMATYEGVAALEATKLNTAVQTVIKALQVNNVDPMADGAFTYTSAGNGLKQIETKSKKATTTTPAPYPLGDQSLEVGTYDVVGVTYNDTTGMITNMDTANIGGIENKNNNYKVTYKGGLTVSKADLYYTYDGEKVYGDANGSGTNKYTLVGKDADSTTTSVNGYLKSFDATKLTVDANNVITAGSGVTSDGLTGTGPMTMSGTIPATTYNITPNGEQAITQAKDGNSYYQVLADPADGTLKTYKVTKFADGTMSISAANTSADAAAYINKNYNMVWKSDTTEAAAKARTTVTSTGVAGAATVINSGDGTGYNAAGTDVGAHVSSELITPAELQVTVTGTRTYGDLMVKDAYNTGAKNVFNVTGAGTTAASSGLKAGDTINGIVDATKMNNIIDGIEALTGNHPANQINEATDVGTYKLIDNTVQTASNINVASKNTTTQHFDILNTNNYNYILKNGAHTETITPETVTVTTTGERVYGDANSTSTINTPTATGMETWDEARWTTTIADDLKNNVQNRTVIGDHAGVYGTKDYTNNKYTTDPNKGALYYLDAQKNEVSTAFGNNYVIDYQDTYTIKKAPLTVTVTGERQYGSNMDANGTYTVTAGAVPSPDTLTNKIYNIDVAGVKNVNGDTASSVLDVAGVKTKLGTVDNGAGGNNTGDIVGSHTNIGTYTGASTVKFTLDNTNAIGTTNTILSSGDYYVAANGTNTLKIVPKKITITTSGSKTYGHDNPAAAEYTVDGSQIETWDQADKYTAHVDTWKGQIVNPATTTTAKGKYGTVNTDPKVAYLRYGTDGAYEATIKNDIGGNYDVSFADSFLINGEPLTITITGERTYGAANNTLSKTSFTATGWEGTDEATYWTTANQNTWKGYYADTTDVNNTHVGTYGTQGSADASNTYKTSGAITLTDAYKNNIKNTLSNYIITFDDQLTINPAPITVTVNGERTYGDNMKQNSYTTAATVTPGTWNVKMDGLVGSDTANPSLALNDTALKGVLNNLDAGDGTATDTLGSHTNARATAYKLGTDLTGTTLTLTDSILKTQAQGGKDYTITNGTHDVKIDPRNVTVTTKGSKTYGDNDPILTKDAVTQSNLTSWDATSYFTDANRTTWAGEVANSTDATSAAGLYGTVNVGKTGYKTSPVLTYTTDQQTAIKNAFNNNGTTSNYTVEFADDFTINKADLTLYTSGQKVYGATATTANLNTITGTGFKNSDAATLALAANQATLKGYVDNAKAAANGNHVGSYGTEGTDGGKTTVLAYDTTEQGNISTLFGDNYTITYTDKFDITPATLTATVTGERDYGTNLPQNSYTTAATATKGTWNVKLEGLTGGDTAATALNDANVKTVLNAIDSGDGTATTKMGSHTNAGTYALNGTALTGTNVVLTQANILAQNANSKYDYTVTNGNHQAQIDKIGVTITTTGSKAYGHDNPDTSKYTITQAGLTDWDKTDLYGTDGSNWKKDIVNSTTKTTPKGDYGTSGTVVPKNAVLTYASGSKLATDLATNYNVTYADEFNIGAAPLVITIIGSKTYGDATDLDVGKYTVSSTGLEGTDTLNYTGLTNTVKLEDNVGTYSKGNGPTTPDTTNSITALTGLSGFDTNNYEISYKTTYTITPRNLNIVTTGTKVYGDADPSTSSYIVTGLSGLTSWDSTKLPMTELQAHIVNNTTEQTDIGNYGTQNGGAAVLTYNTDLQAAAGSNYKVNLADNFTITPRPITYSIEGTKDYGTGSEHTVYGTGSFTNVPDFAQATVNGNTAKNLVNTSNRTTNVGDYANSLLTVSHSGAWTKNYTITENATLHVVPADFTYTSDHTSYWQYQHIPAQTGKVTNSYGEDVSDLAGIVTWPTPADGKVVGFFPIWGRGSNDGTGNYNPIQAAGNPTALEVKNVPKNEQTDSALNENLEGAWQSFRRPILDIMYLKIKDNGFKSWDNGVFVTANPYVPAADKDNYGMITFNGQVLK